MQVSNRWHRQVLPLATGGADDAGGPNAVVTIGPKVLLFLLRGYADPAPQARPGPRFDPSRGVLAPNACVLLLAKLGHRSVVNGAASGVIGTRA